MVRRRAVQGLADYVLVEQQLVARLAWIVLYGDVFRASPVSRSLSSTPLSLARLH